MGGELLRDEPTRGQMPTRLLLVLLVLATLLALVLWPSAAGAGTYDVYSCRLPDGTLGQGTVDLALSQVSPDDQVDVVMRVRAAVGHST